MPYQPVPAMTVAAYRAVTVRQQPSYAPDARHHCLAPPATVRPAGVRPLPVPHFTCYRLDDLTWFFPCLPPGGVTIDIYRCIWLWIAGFMPARTHGAFIALGA